MAKVCKVDREALHGAITILVHPRSASDTKESSLLRAASRAGISYRLARALWAREEVFVSADTAERVLAAAEQHNPGIPHEISDFRSLIAANRAARSSNAARLARMDLEDAPSIVDLALAQG